MQWTMNTPWSGVLREVESMLALGGDLYVYGGNQISARGPSQQVEDTVLTDVLVARAQNGTVNQPWKRLAVSKLAPLPTSPTSMRRL